MTENTVKKADQPEAQMIAIYLRHVSLETASSPVLLRDGVKPDIKLELRVNINSLKEEQDEVVLDVGITGRDGSSFLYMLKLQQAGTLVLKHFEANRKAFFLNTTCPNMLFPYAAQAASTLIAQAGFPPLYLTPIDFVSLYTQQQAAQKADSPASTSGDNNKWATVSQDEPVSSAVN